MARYTNAVCKLCRREGEKLFLKGSRCSTEKCSYERRGYPPGQHGQNMRRKVSGYGIQLREKQKVRRIYGILEKQFHNYYVKAARAKGITGENLLSFLERRLDNFVYRLGFAPSRNSARQLVSHRHFTVNDRIVDIPSFTLRPGDIVKVREKSKNLDLIHSALRDSDRSVDIPWLRLNKAALEGELLEVPKRADIPVVVSEQLIVELYSK
ncbi:MAG: 30S ribosomal protein S4 [candidate division Zixibacteria bacterium]|nr:30S ribosomal protein S4 [candidate division Zixibacteria bacterium]MBU1471476.1 30S ribosomal protein S4 [candidate division Zixibacteria bacterium]MBU2625608.1 30S ribosomal protein S4 [candidate division Zixibacteria bacterium]